MKARLLVVAVLLANLAAAEPANDDTAALSALREALRARLAAQPDDIQLNYQLGVVAYKLGDYLTALEMFERVLALNPSHAGALLDMAITYYAKGDYDQASVLFTRLASLASLPPQAERAVASYLELLAERQQRWRSSGSVTAALGTSSNANQGLSVGSVNLPYIGGSVNQELTQDFRARADQFADLVLEGRAERPWADKRLYLMASWRERRWASERDSNQRWLVGGAGLVLPLAGRTNLDSSLLLVNGQLGNRTLQQAAYWFNQVTLDKGPRAHWLRLEAAMRHFPVDPVYDSHQTKLILGSGYARANWKVTTELGAAHDTARRNRPGGNRRRFEWLLDGTLRLAHDWWLNSQWRFEHERQQSPFSPAFGGFTRTDRGHTVSVSLEWEPDPHYRVELSALRSRLDSNLDLYDLNRTEWRLGVRHSWR